MFIRPLVETKCRCRHCGMGVSIAMLQINPLTPTRNQTADTDEKNDNHSSHFVTSLSLEHRTLALGCVRKDIPI